MKKQSLSANKIKSKDIKVLVVNKPDEEQSKEKIKELSNFLSKTWHMPLDFK